MIVAALALALAAQAEPPPLPPPPPPASDDDKPPVVELKPAPPPPPVTAPAPPPTTPPTPLMPRAAPTPDQKPRAHIEAKHGIDPLPAAFVEMAAGTGACCVGSCIGAVPCFAISVIPTVGLYLGLGACAVTAGTAVGITEGTIGDVFGTQRAPLVWPIVGAVVPLVVTTGVLTGSQLYLQSRGVVPPADPSDQAALARYEQQAGPVPYIDDVALLVGAVAAVVAPAIIYGVIAVDKGPGDEGQGFPGVFSPAAPAPTTKVVTVAMAY